MMAIGASVMTKEDVGATTKKTTREDPKPSRYIRDYEEEEDVDTCVGPEGSHDPREGNLDFFCRRNPLSSELWSNSVVQQGVADSSRERGGAGWERIFFHPRGQLYTQRGDSWRNYCG